MASLSIKNVPDDVVARLRAQAARNHRSLQGELLHIVTCARGDQDMPFDLAEFERTNVPADIDKLMADIRATGYTSPDESTAMIREARDLADGRR